MFLLLSVVILAGLSVEKDDSALSEDKQTLQLTLFSLLKDFLKAPMPEELHSVLAFILTVGEEQQVELILNAKGFFFY